MMMKVAMGGAAFALIEKQVPNFPTVPILGRAGTVAVAAYMLGGKKQGLARDIALAAATLAAYQFLKDGKVSGDDAMGDETEGDE